MKKVSIFQCSVLTIIILLLTGCVAKVPQNYSFSSNDNHGIAAYSIACNVTTGNGVLFINPYPKHLSTANKLWRQAIIGQGDRQYFTCTEVPASSLSRELQLAKLRPGRYAITSWQIRPTAGKLRQYDTISSTQFKPIIFYVKRHRVTYLGNIALLGNSSSNNQYTTLLDKAFVKQDMQRIHQHLPKISRNQIDVRLAKIGKETY